MEEHTVLIIVLSVSLFLNIILGIGVRNLLLQTEDFEKRLYTYRDYVKDKIQKSLKALQDADIKGSFESDDEVGSVFKDMKEIITNLNKTPF